MKKIIIMICAMFIATVTLAENENEAIMYILKDDPNIDTLIHTKPWRIVNNDGNKILIWDNTIGTNAPTFEQIYAVTNLAVPWYKDKVKNNKSDINEVSPELIKAIVVAMIKVVNKRIGSDKITVAEMKEAIKNELK
jgi:hypothetical protein